MELKINGNDVSIKLTDVEAKELSRKLEDPDVTFIRLGDTITIHIAG